MDRDLIAEDTMVACRAVRRCSMPVRSLNSPVLRWPDRETVDRAARQWAREQAQHHPELLRLGYFGSYARGDWGVGSDLDLVAVVRQVRRPFLERALDWDLRPLPVPAELRVYTEAEWQEMLKRGDRFSRTLTAEVRWIWPPERGR